VLLAAASFSGNSDSAYAGTAHHPVDVVFRDGLQDDAAELILQDFDFGTGFNPMLAAKFGRDHMLAFGGKRMWLKV